VSQAARTPAPVSRRSRDACRVAGRGMDRSTGWFRE